MFNQNKITKILGATFILVSSNSVLAETVNTSTTVTVQNAFTLAETTGLDFGTIRAVADATGGVNIAALIVAPDGSTTTSAVANAAISALAPATPGVFTVSAAAAFTDVTITFPADFELTATGAPPTSPNFDVLQADWSGTVVGGANDGATVASGGTMQTDATGGVAVNVGTSLKTDATASTTPYIDAAYTGNYTIDVSY